MNQTTESETPMMSPEEAFAAEAERIVCQSDRVAVSCVRAVLAFDTYFVHRAQCVDCKGKECAEAKAIRKQAMSHNAEAVSALRLTKRGLVR